MLRPIFDQKSRQDGRVSKDLERALRWWLRVLSESIAERREWTVPERPAANLFCDARGVPPQIAAVLICDGIRTYTNMKPSDDTLKLFTRRRDNQIMGLELLSISLGLTTFKEQLSNRKVVVHSDNTGSEAATRSGTAKSFDHAQLVHEQWAHAVLNRMHLFVKRVPTDDNIADLPSRLDFKLLKAIGATPVEPVMEESFLESGTWEVLLERWKQAC